MIERVDDGALFGNFWIEEINGEVQTSVRKKRKYKPKKKEYNGWGSTSLIQFLESIGRDTTNKITQSDVTQIINDYVKLNNLLHPTKKKRIECDARLHLLFGRKSISRLKISDLLESHFVENCGQSDDDFLFDSEDDENVPGACETPKPASSERKSHPKKHVVEKPRSCFAAVNPFNIKLVYLKRSLVEELLKDPETFETKVVGSFIRIKCDPNDYLQKNSHQLLQITGIKKSSGVGGEIRLQASGFIKDISINMLSDDNFSEAECEDLHRRVKDGLLKRPMIVDLEEKARVLHEDMTKHWLAKEIALLENLIERANEKEDLESESTTPDVPDKKDETNFQELSQTTCTKTSLPTEVPKAVTDDFEDDFADEQEWLFHGIPQVTTGYLDFSESKTPEVPDKKAENNMQGFWEPTCTKESLVTEVSKTVANGFLDFSESKTPEVPVKKAENNMQGLWEATCRKESLVTDVSKTVANGFLDFSESKTPEVPVKKAENNTQGFWEATFTKESLATEVSKTVANGFACKATKLYASDRTKQENESPKSILSLSGPSEVPLFNMAMNSTALNCISRDTVTSAVHQWSSVPVHQQPAKQTDSAYKKDSISIPAKSNEVMIKTNITRGPSDKQIQVIELSDDDDDEEIEKPSTIKPSMIKPVPAEELQSSMWHYRDPQGQVQGPFPIISLKCWSDLRYFSPDFKTRLRLSKLVIVEIVKNGYQFGEEVDVIYLAE
ncbi:SWIB/MDM2, Plus-3 and GYF domain-containing protein [Trifolium repens]|nr:SWIB/MDM2, Plus-3 and GYF domain-containing protein [Trifolium repens]